MNTRAYLSDGAVKSHKKELAALGRHALIMTGRSSAKKCGALADVTDALSSENISYTIFDQTEENPSTETVMAAKEAGIAAKCDFVIGIGGGSPLDAAKAAAVMIANPGSDWPLLYESEPAKALNVAAVPTTCGTGSEVTGASVLTRHDLGTKRTAKQYVFPKLALMDPKYLASAPGSVITSTAIDALGHLIESYVNTSATEESRIKSLTGLHIWKRCRAYIEGTVFTDPAEEHDMYKDLLLASNYAGMAIRIAGTSLPHAFSYYLTYEKQVPHGIAIGIYQPGFLGGASSEDKTAILSAAGFEDMESFSKFIEKICIRPVLEKYADAEELRKINKKSADYIITERSRIERVPYFVDGSVLERIAAGSEAADC